MKGIILAGGKGSRLYPMTLSISKQLLPVYDKPMIYYPLSMLMLAEIKDILVITDPDQLNNFQNLLGNGEQWGISLNYVVQDEPRGLAEAFLLGKKFIGKSPVCLILGDNIFYGASLPELLRSAASLTFGANIFAYEVREAERYGIIEIDAKGNPISLEEKPSAPKSNFAVPGLYYYDNRVVQFAESLKPSKRGELEITDLNKIYLAENSLLVSKLGRGIAWLDAGKPDALVQAAQFVQTVQARQGLMISCIEEIAYLRGFISLEKLNKITHKLGDNDYRDYLQRLCEQEEKSR